MIEEVGYSALLLDDDPMVLRTLESGLKKRGFITWSTKNQTEAIQFVKSHHPNVACIDLHMPGINGIEVIRQMREILPDIRVVVVTGHLDEYEKQVEPLKVRIVEKSSRTINELEIVICEELELSKQEYEALKTKEKLKLKARILFVDDEEEIGDFNREIAIGEGLDAESVHSAEQALEKLKTFKPDILCTDLTMPKMHGDEFIKILKASPEYSSIKIYIGTTGDHYANNRFLAVGVREVINKPFDLTGLTLAMRRWAAWANELKETK